MLRSAYQEAGRAALGRDDGAARPWEAVMRERQVRLRGVHLAQAVVLPLSPDEQDRGLAAAVREFVAAMQAVESRRQVLARELRQSLDEKPGSAPEKGRSGRWWWVPINSPSADERFPEPV